MSKPDPKKAVKKNGRYEMNVSWDRIFSELALGKPKITVYEELKADKKYSYSYQSFFRMYATLKKEKDAKQKELMATPQPATQERSKEDEVTTPVRPSSITTGNVGGNRDFDKEAATKDKFAPKR